MAWERGKVTTLERNRRPSARGWGKAAATVRRRGTADDARHREEFTVFVNNVSKGTHQATLRDVFSEYGEVVDYFIAYRNQKRVGKNTTFAFVRFKRWMDAVRAVEKGDKRKLDNFMIRVFMEMNAERHLNNP
ncbi:transformer-2 protein homolog beta-like [Hibiscus syriacus]|uniref:transformer-2 protein homolog beta-like n=1 Tax=Hibiscus syriacus TaxID=106335 RepID=UPI00192336A3|nr:transformer-2 protein homolog beta-like [Hibiscus syriacus]